MALLCIPWKWNRALYSALRSALSLLFFLTFSIPASDHFLHNHWSHHWQATKGKHWDLTSERECWGFVVCCVCQCMCEWGGGGVVGTIVMLWLGFKGFKHSWTASNMAVHPLSASANVASLWIAAICPWVPSDRPIYWSRTVTNEKHYSCNHNNVTLFTTNSVPTETRCWQSFAEL